MFGETTKNPQAVFQKQNSPKKCGINWRRNVDPRTIPLFSLSLFPCVCRDRIEEMKLREGLSLPGIFGAHVRLSSL